ncbi:MAG TPA: hypothetical protein VK694_03670 [Verrucomicrobiae bacterium]|nr:hypothetical protein [Verrucomicrobiae bacterium]
MRNSQANRVDLDTRIDSFLGRKFKQYPNLSTSEKAIGTLTRRPQDSSPT